MSTDKLKSLARLIRGERELVLARWRHQVEQLPGAHQLSVPAVVDHIPDLLDELADALEAHDDQTILEAHLDGSPRQHGRQRVHDGFDITDVVAEYNVLRGCIHDLAESNGVLLHGPAFHIINRVLDDAIGLAVKTFANEKAVEMQRRREEHLAFVAHDLRTPLSAISLVATLLESELDGRPSEDTAMMFQTLRRNVQRLDALVMKVVQEQTNLQTGENVKIECREIDLWPLVESLLHDLQPLAGASSTTLVNSVSKDLVVWADAHLLTRVFQNLVSNAIEYTPRGQVEIKAQKLDDQRAVECCVCDNGRGIPEEMVDRIFDKLEKDPDKPSGLGLGLSIVKQFVEAHGGTVEVESERGVGSTFRFTLPLPGSNSSNCV